MPDTNPNLVALIGSRICHDLISPIGAINNGLELLDLTGGTSGPEIDLIADSVTNADARIRFFRIAYGAASEQRLGRAEIISVTRAISGGGRHKIDWVPDTDLPRQEVRLAFLAIQCCESALPYGGTIIVEQHEGLFTVTGSGQKVNVDPALWSGLTSGADSGDVNAASVQFALLPIFGAELGRNFRVDQSEDAVTIRF